MGVASWERNTLRETVQMREFMDKKLFKNFRISLNNSLWESVSAAPSTCALHWLQLSKALLEQAGDSTSWWAWNRSQHHTAAGALRDTNSTSVFLVPPATTDLHKLGL